MKATLSHPIFSVNQKAHYNALKTLFFRLRRIILHTLNPSPRSIRLHPISARRVRREGRCGKKWEAIAKQR
jgi:hypothetical protein